ncbi:MAG: hypothetical protein ACRECJ_09255 [Limisphaerales bacterium]
MRNLLRKFRDVIGVGLIWGTVWPATGALLFWFIGIIAPGKTGSDVTAIEMALILARVGFVSGVIFGILLSIFERRKTLAEIPLFRAVLWGVLASALFPLLTIPERALTACPLGAISALASAAIARTAALRRHHSA